MCRQSAVWFGIVVLGAHWVMLLVMESCNDAPCVEQARPRAAGQWARKSDPLLSVLLAVPEGQDAADAAAAPSAQPVELTRRGSS